MSLSNTATFIGLFYATASYVTSSALCSDFYKLNLSFVAGISIRSFPVSYSTIDVLFTNLSIQRGIIHFLWLTTLFGNRNSSSVSPNKCETFVFSTLAILLSSSTSGKQCPIPTVTHCPHLINQGAILQIL